MINPEKGTKRQNAIKSSKVYNLIQKLGDFEWATSGNSNRS
jgi:hypothetical protein